KKEVPEPVEPTLRSEREAKQNLISAIIDQENHQAATTTPTQKTKTGQDMHKCPQAKYSQNRSTLAYQGQRKE
ncbi:hypothetical protein Dimus_028834, partial [Dionaea muscipula]